MFPSIDSLREEPVTPDQYNALQRLADVPRGIAKTLMLAYGYAPELIAGLVRAGLIEVVPDIARIGRQTVEVELVTITDAGRRALWFDRAQMTPLPQ
jgi:DNA-binding MarR family transcriptional regulator